MVIMVRYFSLEQCLGIGQANTSPQSIDCCTHSPVVNHTAGTRSLTVCCADNPFQYLIVCPQVCNLHVSDLHCNVMYHNARLPRHKGCK